MLNTLNKPKNSLFYRHHNNINSQAQMLHCIHIFQLHNSYSCINRVQLNTGKFPTYKYNLTSVIASQIFY